MATPNSVLALLRAYRPSFRNPHDKVAFAVHASLLASGYVLTATGPPAFSDTALSSASTDEVGIEGWNAMDADYGFLYRKEDKGVKNSLLVKCLVMGDKLIVDALVVGGGEEKPVNLQIDVDKYDGASESTNYSDMYKNFEELVNRLNSGILGKLNESSTSCSSSSSSKASGGSEDKPVDQGVGVIEPRGFQPYPASPVFPQVPPFGESDLVPGGGGGMYPPRGTGVGGGMLIGPNDPRWFGGVDGQPGFPGGAPGVPQGARFDPYGPPGVPGFEPNRFTRDPRRPGGGTHPDLEHFGSGSDFI